MYILQFLIIHIPNVMYESDSKMKLLFNSSFIHLMVTTERIIFVTNDYKKASATLQGIFRSILQLAMKLIACTPILLCKPLLSVWK